MHWKSTLLLVVLAGGAGAWLWKGDEWWPRSAPRGAPPDPAELTALEADLTPETITRIEVAPPGADPFVLERTAAGWRQPGGWPLRAAEVNELVDALGTLRTRFRPEPLPADGDLAAVGLAPSQKPIAVTLTAGGRAVALQFGEPPARPGESAFTRPAFVRIDGAAAVLRLGPDVMPVLRRPAEAYLRRQLFYDVERVKVAGGASPFAPPGAPPDPAANVSLPGPGVTEIRVADESKKVFGFTPWPLSHTYALRRTGPTPAPAAAEKGADPSVSPDRLADAWAVVAPVRDRPDPAKLRQLLAAVPELWVEDFVPAGQRVHADHPYAVAQALPVPLEPLPGLIARLNPAVIPDPREELKKSKKRLTVVTKDGPVTVTFGGVARVATRDEPFTLPAAPGMPPRTVQRKVETPYRYAQIEGNPQLFTVAADKLDALFGTAGEAVEARVARFATDDVQAVTVAAPGKPPVVLARTKGNPKAAKPEEKRDRWFVEQAPNPLPAEAGAVTDLLGRLAGFTGDNYTDLYRADPAARGLDPAACVAVTVVTRERRPDGEPEAPPREYKILIGAPDLAAGKLPVQLAGWPRITLVDDRAGPPAAGWLGPKLFPDRLEPTFRRDSVAYRSRKLFDTADPKARLTAVTVDGAGGFALKQEKTPDGGEAWKLTAPIASAADPKAADALRAKLGELQATEFVAERAADPAAFGLDKPKFTATVAFGDGRTYKLEVGGPRPGKPEAFARLDGGAVFGLPTAETDALAAGALKLLPLQVWAVPLDKLTGVEITRFDTPAESYALARDGTNWKLTGPFAAPVTFLDAQPTAAALCTLPAASYEALAVTDAAKYGFDKPFARVKLTYTEKREAGTRGGNPPDKGPDGDRTATKAVVIGGVAPNGIDRYARLDDPNAPVFVLPPNYLVAARTPPLALLDRNLLNLAPARVAKVQVSGTKPEDAVTLTKDDKGAWAAEGAAFAVDAVVAGQVAATFAPLPVERLAAYGAAVKWADFGLDKPEWTVAVTLGGDKAEVHKVEVGKADPTGGRFARVDGGPAVGVIPPAAVRALARPKLDFADRTLFAFKPDDLLALARTTGKDELELAPGAGDGWDVVKPAPQKADRPLMEELADALGRLRAEKVVAFGKKEDVFKQYGLDPPEATLTLTVGEKMERKVLRFGRPADAARPDGDRYVAVDGAGADAAVGVLPAALANKLLAPPVSFRDRTVAKFLDADKLELERGPRKATFAKVNGTWKVTAPVAADAEVAALDDLVADLARLRAADWAADKPTPAELKAFGLDSPEATWTVSNGDKPVLVLRVGRTTADGRAYAAAGAGGPVAVLGPPQAAKVLAEYRARKPWALDGFQAEAVEVARGDKSFTLKKVGAAWVDPAAPGDAIDARGVTELLGTLTALRVERYAVDADADLKLLGLEKPEVTITVVPKDGDPRVLAIGGPVGGTDDKQRYARVVDKGRSDAFVLSAADTARLVRDRGTFVLKK
jgi:hypothetical protein